jgi:TRAP-type mannitol/chloroaromatic compound transport system permease large subunit
MTGVGAAVVVVVTLLSLPPLLRLMRPDGLRTE